MTKLFDLTKVLALAAVAIVVAAGASGANAQRRDDRNDRNDRQEMNRQQDARWRVRHSGRYYNVDQRQSELLRQAVNQGYQQGYQAGRGDRSSRRRNNYRKSNVYRSGTYGYQSYVNRNLYQYYFQQGFQRGYDDGYSSNFRYGRDEGGSVNVLGNIVESILGLQQY